MLTRVVLCGTFHRQHKELEHLFAELEINSCRVLSPLSLDFTDLDQPAVKTSTEDNLSLYQIETFHLRAIRDADMIWLHAPAGHVGISASYELGFAEALGIPVFCKEELQDEMLRDRVHKVQSVFRSLEMLSTA